MPLEGTIKRARDIGYVGRALHVWVICPKCERGRWGLPAYTKTAKYTQLCVSCQARQRAYKDGHAIPIEVACHNCGKSMKAPQKRFYRQEYTFLCASCIGKKRIGNKSNLWKGGRHCARDGYVYVWVSPDSPFYSMAHHSYIPEHRLVMAQSLGRCLFPWEIVHHIDGVRHHNSRRNLKLLPTDSEHMAYIALQHRINVLEQRVTLLEAENTLLKEEQNESNFGIK